GAHPAERLHLDHHHVGGLGSGHGVGVGGAADGLVGGDRHLGGPAQRGQVRYGGARLLGVLQPTGGAVQDRQPGAGGLIVPGGVGVDADLPGGAEGVPDRLQPRLLLGEGLPRFGDLHLGGAAATGAGDDLVGALRGGGRHGDVHRDPGAYRVGETLLGGLAGGDEPGAGGGGVVVP